MANVSDEQSRRTALHPSGGPLDVSEASPLKSQRRAPAWLSALLIALTCVCIVATTLTLWTEATVLNTDRFTTLVEPLRHDPETIARVSNYVADEMVTALDISGRTDALLPVGGQFLAGPIEQSVHDFAQSRAATLLASDKARRTWIAIERSTHAQLVAALRGQSSTVRIEDGTLSVNLLPLIAATLGQLQQVVPGFVPSGPPIPDLTGVESPAEQRQMLSEALGVQLAPDFGMVTLLRSDALTAAQRVVAVLDTLRFILPIITLALAIAAVWFAADRRRAWLWLGIGTATAMLMVILLVSFIVDRATAAVTAAPAQALATAVVEPLRADLLGLLGGILIVSALVALAAYVAGNPKWLVRLRSGASPRPANG